MMLQKLLDNTIESGIFNGNISLDAFKKRLAPQTTAVAGSLIIRDAALYMLIESEGRSSLVVLSPYEKSLSGFSGESIVKHKGSATYYALECPLDHGNAVQLRKNVPHTAPSVLSCSRSFGTGDRIGGKAAATPWHTVACRE